MILSKPKHPLDSIVNSLFSVSGQWDAPRIQQLFSPEDAAVILSIPLGDVSIPNRYIWHSEANGLFSVCSGYCLAQSDDIALRASSSPSAISSWWKGMWNMVIPSKLTIFVWRLCLNQLPVNVNLIQRALIL